MSLYNIIGLIALGAVALIGAVVKIVLARKRKKLDGVHGFATEERTDVPPTDGWENL